MRPVLQDLLSRAGDRAIRIKSLSIPRVSVRKDDRLAIEYRISQPGQGSVRDQVLFGFLLASGEEIPSEAERPDVFFVPRLQLLVPMFPYDLKLRKLALFFDHRGLEKILRRGPVGISRGEDVEVEDLELLGYRPERRAVLRIRLRDRHVPLTFVVKLTSPPKAAANLSNLQRLERAGFDKQATDRITVPQTFECSDSWLVWMEYVPDPALHDLSDSPTYVRGCAAAGGVLKKLNAVLIDQLPEYTMEDERGLLQRATGEVSAIYPQLAERLARALAWVEDHAPAEAQAVSVPIHRDFYDKQVLVGPDRTTLLDMDTLAQGDPALDVGNFLAQLDFRANQTPDLRRRFEAGREAFVDVYHTMDRSFWRRVDWWEAAAALRLLCVYSLRPRWQGLARSLLEGWDERHSFGTEAKTAARVDRPRPSGTRPLVRRPAEPRQVRA